MLPFVLARGWPSQISHRSAYHNLIPIVCRNRNKSASTSGGSGHQHLGDEQVITGSLSGAKHVSKLVPPSSTSIGGKTNNEARLLVSGPDASGIVASFSQLLYGHGCGIVDCTSESSEEDNHDETLVVATDFDCKRLLQHRSNQKHHERMFFQRILFDYSNLNVEKSLVEKEIESTCQKFGMESQLVCENLIITF
mmetsp:Transcript_16757/g.35417  ORF Transcript_16757/g.35417 Transcript_16757/m.35417 type:complete len:195 (-) Transcript_16757:62-646(-)